MVVAARLGLGGLVLSAALGCHDEPLARVATPGAPGGAAAVGGAGTGGAGAGGIGGDEGGAAGGPATNCGVVDPALTFADAAELFAYPRVPTFDFYLPPEAWDALKANAAAEQYTEAEACFEGRGLGRVGLRFKGSYGSLYECADQVGVGTCRKLSMKVKFSEYVPAQRFYGLKRLSFNANRHDDTRIKERLAYDLFRAMGIIAPRAAWAVLRVNGVSQGLYGMVEVVDGRFTADRWPDRPDANLYKELWPDNPDPGWITSRLATNEEDGDVSAAVAFATAMTTAAEEDLRSTLARYLDLRQLARFLAVEDAVASYDGITYFWTDGVTAANHNYYLYEAAPDRFTLIPWDVESSFWINPDHAAPHWTSIPDDCRLTYEYWGGLALAPACDRTLRAMASELTEWRAAAQELLDGPFAEAAMLQSIEQHAEFIRGEAEADPTPSSYSDFDSSLAFLRDTIPELRARLAALTDEP